MKGSATAGYRAQVDDVSYTAYKQKQKVDPMYHEKIDRLLDSFARRLAENTNALNNNTARVPSILIAGGSNFPVRAKQKQNSREDTLRREYAEIMGLVNKIRSVGTGGISSDDPNALAKLREKRDRLVKHQELMKAANAAIRLKNAEEGDRRLRELGFTPDGIAELRNHGGYDFAKQFYTDAYKSAIKIVGGEQYVLSAVMHADERNRAMSEALGRDVYHYRLHVVYIPVVEKKILWSKRCKDKSLVGTVKEVITQVSSSKKWKSHPALDEQGKPILQKNGKPVLRKSYSVLQDDFFNAMRDAGYTDVERGERGSSEEHLTVTQFKVKREQERLVQLQEAAVQAQSEAEQKCKEAETARKEAAQAKSKLDDVAPLLKGMEKLAADFSEDPERTLPEAGPLESAKSYREKKVKPLWKKIVKVLRSVYRAYFNLKSKFERLQVAYDREVSKNNSLSTRIVEVCAERDSLKGQVRDYDRLKRAIGPEKVDRILEAAHQQEQAEKGRKQSTRQKTRLGTR